jgi:ESS family glutamate:Na+ symporter
MTTGLNFWDTQVWSFIITMTLLLGAMILANIMRNTIPLIRKLMIPSSVLGGFLLLFVDFLLDKLVGVKLINATTLEMLTYHGLGLGFVAMALRRIDKKQDKKSKTGSFDTGVTVVANYLIQAIFGLIITVALYYVLDSFWASGLLLPMGYGQGPGQAYNWGHNYELTYGFENGTSFGLTVAAMGFVSAV